MQGERVSFTGTLASMTHQRAHELVEEHGGTAMPHVSRQMTMLVIGEEGWPLEPDGKPSQKLTHVSEWRQEGVAIRILNESEWLHLLGLDERRQEVHRLYTPAMLCQLLGVTTGTIRRWERLGLIRPVRKVYRLPYFDYQEVTSARRIADLLASGVSRQELEENLLRLQQMWPEAARSLAQLDLLERDAHVLIRDDQGLLEPVSRQRHFDFEPSPPAPPPAGALSTLRHPGAASLDHHHERAHWSTEAWFREGCRFLDAGHLEPALEAFRLCLMERPGDAELNFLLAETLYRLRKLDGAIERYYAAVESDHNYIEGWTQLGCLHAEKGELTSALEALNIALDIHPDYPDAHWHAANILSQLGQSGKAILHWEQYLLFDKRGPWAEQARQHLAEAAERSASNE
jgi:tetratricopeptide (TPR) repeat protein